MGLELLTQADYVLNACGRAVPPKGYKFVDLPKFLPFHVQFGSAAVAVSPYAIILSGSQPPDPVEPSQFLGAAVTPGQFSSVSAVAGSNLPAFGLGRIGPYAYGTTLTVFLLDASAGKVRAFSSANGGVTWAELDAAHAPSCFGASTIDGAGNLGCAQNGSTVYVGYFSGSSANPLLTIQKFNLSTGVWGTALVSTLSTTAGVGPTQQAEANQITLVYRPADDSVFFITTINVFNSVGSCFYAQCFPNGIGWVNTFVLLSTPLPLSGNQVGNEFQVACLDNQGNICCAFSGSDGTTGPSGQKLYLWFRRIHPDNSLGTLQKLDEMDFAGGTGLVFNCLCGPTNDLYILIWNPAANAGAGASEIYSAVASTDTPVWTITLLFAGDVNSRWMDAAFINGVLTVWEINHANNTDNKTIRQSVAPFSTFTTLGVAPNTVFQLYAAPYTGAGATATATQARLENLSNTLFLANGIMLSTDPVQVRIKWPNGRYWNQFPSPNPNASTGAGTGFPQGTGGNIYAFDEEIPIETGGRVAIEMSGPTGPVDIQLWGVLRYLLKETPGGDALTDNETCVIGYPAQAQASKAPSCLIGYPVSGGAKGIQGSVMIADPIEVLKARPRFECWPNGNIFAPEFLLGNQRDPNTPAGGYRDEAFTFLSDVYTVISGGASYSNAIPFPGQDDLVIRRWRAIISWLGGANGNPVVGLRSPSGYSLTGGDQMPIFLGFWIPMFPTLLGRAGTLLIADISLPAGGGSITIQFEFDAAKRRKVAA